MSDCTVTPVFLKDCYVSPDLLPALYLIDLIPSLPRVHGHFEKPFLRRRHDLSEKRQRRAFHFPIMALSPADKNPRKIPSPMPASLTEHPDALPFHIEGPETGTPVVLLHGFGGDRQGWINMQLALAAHRRTLAFDLPGHGAALDWPQIGNAAVAARAVRQSLNVLELERVHLVGHSMGGATAAIVALQIPEHVASLTLICPGGFGTEINHKLISRYAAAEEEDELIPLMEQFFGFDYRMPRLMCRAVAAQRAEPGQSDAFREIAADILKGEAQKPLPLEKIAALPMPIKVIWGEQDRIVPCRQIDTLPGTMARHVFPGVGHMPYLERPREVARLILENTTAE